MRATATGVALTPSPSPTLWERGAAYSPSPNELGEGDIGGEGIIFGVPISTWNLSALRRCTRRTPAPVSIARLAASGQRYSQR